MVYLGTATVSFRSFIFPFVAKIPEFLFRTMFYDELSPVEIHTRANGWNVSATTFQEILLVFVLPPLSVSLPGLQVAVRVCHEEDVPVKIPHHWALPLPGEVLGQAGEHSWTDPLPGMESSVQPEYWTSSTLPVTNLQQQQSAILDGPTNLLNLPDNQIG